MRGNEYGTCISGHLHIFAILKHLMMLLRCNFFFRASFLHPITDTGSMQDHAAQICLNGNILKQCL